MIFKDNIFTKCLTFNEQLAKTYSSDLYMDRIYLGISGIGWVRFNQYFILTWCSARSAPLF